MPHLVDPRLAKKVRRLFRIDPITVQRSASTVDAEGDATAVRSTVGGVSFGTLYGITEAEDLAAAQRGTKVDKALALELGLDVRGDDWVTAYGITYEVVEIAQLRLHQRALLRVVVV